MAKSSIRGFTLVELLVVIAIIAILVTVSVPTISSMSEKSKQSHCLSNLRRLSTACLLYAAEHDNQLAKGAPSSGGSLDQFWHRQIFPYLDLGLASFSKLASIGKRSPYLCPSDQNPYGGVLSYGFNGWLCPTGDYTQLARLSTVASSRILLVESSSSIAASRWQFPPLTQYRHRDQAMFVRVDGSVASGDSQKLGNPSSHPELWKP